MCIRKAIGECNERTGLEKDSAPSRPAEPVFVDLLGSPGINFQPAWHRPVRQPYLTYRAARLHRPAESIPGSLNVYKYGLCILDIWRESLPIHFY